MVWPSNSENSITKTTTSTTNLKEKNKNHYLSLNHMFEEDECTKVRGQFLWEQRD
jgi:hypothetical protein